MSRLVNSCLILFIFAVSACTQESSNTNLQAGEISVLELNAAVSQPAGHYGYGKAATAEEIAGWDIDVRPDGVGLPPGSGTPEDGEGLYEEKCAVCHGSFGEGVGRNPVLAGGEGTLTSARPEKTVGSYWPYASTLWDYIHRAMPFTEPESLTDDEVYAISAYVLYLNELIEYDFAVNQDTLATIEMPNKDGFFLDNRPDVVNEPCMSDCKDPASIEITSEQTAAADGIDEDGGKIVGKSVGQSTGESIYLKACAVCHASGVGEAPIPGDQAAWSSRMTQGRDTLINSSMTGKGIMPAKGGRADLADEDVAAAVDYMIEQLAH